MDILLLDYLRMDYFYSVSQLNHFVDLKNVRTVGGKGGDGCISLLQIWANDRAGKAMDMDGRIFMHFSFNKHWYFSSQVAMEVMQVIIHLIFLLLF